MKEIVKATIVRPYFPIHIFHRKDDIADVAVIKEMFTENVYQLEAGMFVQDRSIVVDVGANIGTFTMLALKIAQENNKKITVYAVEPEKNNLELLKKNLEANPRLLEHGSEVIIVEKGISDFHGSAKIIDGSGGSRIYTDSEEDLQEIDVITFDEFVNEYELDRIDFTKIDIEGSEVPLITGASLDTLLRTHFYAIEFDRFNEIDGFLRTMKPFMKDFSFKTWGIPVNGCNVYFENHHWLK